ncbi:hypothetical protein Y032_1493g3897, partial [Ancylostoma ceylanicum]
IIEHVRSSPWEMVEVTLVSENYGNGTFKYALDEFHDLFDEFAQQQGIRFHRGNFREILASNDTAKYGLRGVHCEQFRQFLSGVKAVKYHLQYAAVKCGAMTFSFCLAFSCTPEEFPLNSTTTAVLGAK